MTMHIKIRVVMVPLIFISLYTINNAMAAPLLEPRPDQARAAHLSAEVLTRHHYRKVPMDDAISSVIFDNYLKALDSEKLFFLQSDIDSFSSARTSLDDAILHEDIRIPFVIFNRYKQANEERFNYARGLLDKGFDFNVKESYLFNRKNATWAQSENEMNDLWRKRVKNDWLQLKLAGIDDKVIHDKLKMRYDKILSGLSKINGDDVFQYFMNAYTTAIDPHTSYFGKRAADEFDKSIKESIVGIGAVLQEKDEYIVIRELVAGGSALLSGKLKPGDRIVGVGQGQNGAVVDVLGWRLDDTVALLRGDQNSVVVIEVLPAEAGPDGAHKYISLTRKSISLDDQSAKKSIVEVKVGNATQHIGVIVLAGFYQDFAAKQNGDKNFRSATRDVKRLLEEFKNENVDSVLIDLRNNGGGALDEAINLTGLFVDQGPVMQTRDNKGEIKIESVSQLKHSWDGPLGVLINHASAGASEIFAAAIQDYGRGVVIGEPSFGSGTVQNVINLDLLVKNKKPEFGEIKMTIAEFFRINGEATQLRGVAPDISFPSQNYFNDFGESSYDNALPWAQIKAVDFTPAGDLSGVLPILKRSHDVRVNKDKDFQYLNDVIIEASKQLKKTSISLNEEERRKDIENQNALLKSKKYIDSKDVVLNEAVRIISDEFGLLNKNQKVDEFKSTTHVIVNDPQVPSSERKKSNHLPNEKLVLMPLRLDQDSINLKGSMETALLQGLQQNYIVYSGDRVLSKAKAIFAKESKKQECDETYCLQKIAGAFQSELVGVANITKQDGGYFISLVIQNVFDNKVIFSNAITCPRCSSFEAVEKLKELSVQN
jgi:carboxyl-terminal processing protease